ncbi:unnamed protein product, partial [Rotaria magnacalcarata]
MPSTLPIHVPPINTIQTSLFNNPNDINSISLQPPMTSLPPTILHPSFTMNLNNNLPTFKGLTHERPIQFINNFEIRASALVGSTDLLLLQTVQQVLFDGALIWFGQLQKSPDRVNTWNDFKFRFYERYHTSAKVQSLRTELRLLFQDDNENTLDYFERLKTLMTEIDPDCSDHWLKHKFIQKLRSDIRTRLDVDINLPIRDIVRKSQNIESSIEQQKVDEKLKLVANQEKKNIPSLLTNNLSINSNNHQQLSSPPTNNLSSSCYTSDSIFSTHNTSNLNTYNNQNNLNNNSNNNYNFRPNKEKNYNNSSYGNNFTKPTNQHSNNYNNNNNNSNNHSHDNKNNSNRINRNNNYNNNTNHNPIDNHPRSILNSHNSSNNSTRSRPPQSINSDNSNRSSTNKTTRWWCSHCQR